MNTGYSHAASYLMSRIYSHEKPCYDDFANEPRPYHSFAIIHSGSVIMRENDTIVTAKAGDVIFVPEGSRYNADWMGERIIFHSVHFSFNPACDPLRTKRLSIRRIDIDDTKELQKDFDNIIEYVSSNDEHTFLVLGAFYDMCYRLLPLLKAEHICKTHKAVRPALDYLATHFADRVSVDELAEQCCLSSSRFYTCFKKATGFSPIAYKNRLCIRYAMRALIADPEKSVEEIATEYGFESVAYFRRTFKAMAGKTPSEYRRQQPYL